MDLSPKKLAEEKVRCSLDPAYFIDKYCWIYNATDSAWIPFHPWPAQVEFGNQVIDHDLIIALKARQLGFTWYILALVVWLTTVHKPGSTVILFSKREDDAAELIERISGMLERLPKEIRGTDYDAKFTEINLANGSRILAFPTTGGHGYTATWAIIDEADKLPVDLKSMVNAVKPTIDAGGKLVILSTIEKSKPESYFKKLYKWAKAKKNDFWPIFMPWSARPDRTQEWYEKQKRNSEQDDLWQEYPATDVEALASKLSDKRINPEWLARCYVEMDPLTKTNAPAIPGLQVFVEPVATKEGLRRYVIGSDTAEGKRTSDDSVATVLDLITGEEVACLCGKLGPEELGMYIDMLGTYYHNSPVLVERNNHGHAVLLWLKQNSKLRMICGHDGNPGWVTNAKWKPWLYATACEIFKDGDCVIHSFETWEQLSNIEGRTHSAPDGQHDDRAMSYVLSLQAQVIEFKKMGGKIITGGDSVSKNAPDEVNPHRIKSVAAMLDTMKF